MATHDIPVIPAGQEAPRPQPRLRSRTPIPVDAGGLGISGLAAATVAALALVVFAVQLPALVQALFRNPDIASMPHLATLLAGAPADRTVTLSNAPEYESLTILRATAEWSGHRVLWQALPFVLAAAGLLVLARTMWVTWGRWAAAMAVAALAVTAEGLRMTLFGINAHAFSLLSVIVLGAVLVAFARKPPRSAVTWVLAGLGLVALIAPGVPDLLLVLTGIVPFALAGVATWWLAGGRAHRGLAIFTVSVSASATLLGLLFAAHMRAADIAPTPTFGVRFATAGQLQHNPQVMLDGLAYLAGAHTFGQKVSLSSLLGVVVGGAVIVGFAAGVWATVARLRTYAGHPRLARNEPPERLAFLVFWGAAVLLSIASYLASDLPKDAGTGRYLVPAFYGIAVLLPALALHSRRARAYVAAGVLAFSIGVVARHIVQGPEEFGGGPTPAEVASVRDFAVAQGATIGYAGYQDSEVLTWDSHAELQVFPIYAGFGCPRETCRFPIMSVSSWYAPRDGVRSFVVTHPPATYTQLATLPRGAGRPIAQAQFGSLGVSVYDHDVARDLEAELPAQ
jgi:riboflavin transporter FmnP